MLGGISPVSGLRAPSTGSVGQTHGTERVGLRSTKSLEDEVSDHAVATGDLASVLLMKTGTSKEHADDLSGQIVKQMTGLRVFNSFGLEIAKMAARIHVNGEIKRHKDAEAAGKQVPTNSQGSTGPGSTSANAQELKDSLRKLEEGLGVFDDAINQRQKADILFRNNDDAAALTLIQESSTALNTAQQEILTIKITLEIDETQVDEGVATDNSSVESSHHQGFNPETNLQAKQNDKNTAAANRAEETRTHNLVERNDAAQEARIEEMKLLEEQQKNRAELKAYLDKHPKFPVTPGRFAIPEPPSTPPAAPAA